MPDIAAKGVAERANYALSELVENKRIMDALQRYETRFDRQYMRALRMFRELRGEK